MGKLVIFIMGSKFFSNSNPSNLVLRMTKLRHSSEKSGLGGPAVSLGCPQSIWLPCRGQISASCMDSDIYTLCRPEIIFFQRTHIFELSCKIFVWALQCLQIAQSLREYSTHISGKQESFNKTLVLTTLSKSK